MKLASKQIVIDMKARQAEQVAALGRKLKLVIVRDNDDPVIAKYVGLKVRYGAEIGVEVEDALVESDELADAIARANREADGLIVQLPIVDKNRTDEMIALIDPAKDVDGLTGVGPCASATAMAVDLLIRGHDIDLEQRKIALVGHGRLVGAPLAKMWRDRGLKFTVFCSKDDLSDLINYDLIVTAVGKPGLIKPDMVVADAIVVDAGTASEDGVIRGDVADEMRERTDVSITPKIGGVGPLTVCGLFENLLKVAH